MLYSESIENSVQLFDIPGIPEYKITCTGQVYSLFSKKFINPRNTSGRGYYNYILYLNQNLDTCIFLLISSFQEYHYST